MMLSATFIQKHLLSLRGTIGSVSNAPRGKDGKTGELEPTFLRDGNGAAQYGKGTAAMGSLARQVLRYGGAGSARCVAAQNE